MPLSLILACLWGVAAGVALMAPGRFRWPMVWTLIATGIPLLGYVTFAHGPVIGLLALFGGVSVLRWASVRETREAAQGPDDAVPEREDGAWSW
jgi:hypothetical protein